MFFPIAKANNETILRDDIVNNIAENYEIGNLLENIDDETLNEVFQLLENSKQATEDYLSESADTTMQRFTNSDTTYQYLNLGQGWRIRVSFPHDGSVNRQSANHVNVEFQKETYTNSGRYQIKRNYHIVKSQTGSRTCYKVWESVTKSTIFNQCYNGQSFSDAATDIVHAIAQHVSNILPMVLLAATIIALIIVVTASGGGLAPVAFSTFLLI